ncbi:MAG: inorganic diphosphatase [Candidatus Eremiobacteraeota bacterium]|nr:inorganic diphosphatase [Candidatus Eremiobacteraeota bacterium]
MAKSQINPTDYDAIPTYVPHEKEKLVYAVIETPAQTRHKYAFDAGYGIMLLKQTLAEGLMWPYDYGFIPQTLAEDGDPTDVLVISDVPTITGCLVKVRIIGAVLLKKNGTINNRLIACPQRQDGVSMKTDGFEEIKDVPKDTMDGIERFLVEYSEEQGNTIEYKGTCSRKKAFAMIDADRKRRKRAKKSS